MRGNAFISKTVHAPPLSSLDTLQGSAFGLRGVAERKAILPGIGNGNLPGGRRPGRQESGNGRNSESLQKGTTIHDWHGANLTLKNDKRQRVGAPYAVEALVVEASG